MGSHQTSIYLWQLKSREGMPYWVSEDLVISPYFEADLGGAFSSLEQSNNRRGSPRPLESTDWTVMSHGDPVVWRLFFLVYCLWLEPLVTACDLTSSPLSWKDICLVLRHKLKMIESLMIVREALRNLASMGLESSRGESMGGVELEPPGVTDMPVAVCIHCISHRW